MTKIELKSIIDTLKQANTDYYTHGSSELSDAEFDQLKESLTKNLHLYPELNTEASEIFNNIGSYKSTQFNEIAHTAPMLSLDAVYTKDEFDKYITNTFGVNYPVVIEPKLDGLSIELVYNNGIFVRAVTRGNGTKGEDVSANIVASGSIPTILSQPFTGSVRGEVIITKSDFATLKHLNLANTRNAAVGALKQKDTNKTIERKLTTYVYDIMTITSGEIQKTQYDIKRYLQMLGFNTVPFQRLCPTNMVFHEYDALVQTRDTFDFEMDGVVIKINDLNTQQALGYKHTCPRWAVAWKFPAKAAISKVISVEIQVSKNGTLTPVAKINPASIGGTTISSVSLHNYDIVKSLDIMVGDTVTIERAGDVIPEITKVHKNLRSGQEKEVFMPSTCPFCGSNTSVNGAYLICPNDTGKCVNQFLYQLSHFISKEALNVDGVSVATLEVLTTNGWVKELKDLYTFDTALLQNTPGFGQKKIQNIKSSIEQSTKTTLKRFLYSLSMKHIGQRASETLATEAKTLDAVLSMTEPTICRLLGPNIGKEVFAELKSRSIEIIELSKYFTFDIPNVKSVKTGIFTGKKVCITGTFSEKRSKIQEIIVNQGGEIASGITSDTNLLLVGVDAGSKLDKARDKGIEIWDESVFWTKVK